MFLMIISITTLSLSSLNVFKAIAEGAPIIIKAGHGVSENDPYHLGLKRMMEEFEKRTDGKYKTEIYPMNQIGTERDLIEGLQLGSVGMAVTSTGNLASFVPALGVVDIPFMIKDYAHADRVYMGPIGKELADVMSVNAGLKCLGFWENGFRILINSKRPVNSVGDVAGLKLRTMENEYHMALWRELGANPVPLNGAEAFTALMQGTVDGLENAQALIYTLKYWEAAKYVAVTEHLYSPAVAMVSSKLWDGMTPDEQKILEELFKENSVYERETAREAANKCIEQLKEVGVEITYPDKQPFIDKLANLRERLAEPFGDIVSRIYAEADK
jgi:tripartite ATP-independent transporter DctP family solute receptor